MARPTQKEIDEWNARMNEPDPDDDDVIVETPDGHKVHMKYGRVKPWLARHGLDFDDVEIEQADDGDPSQLQDPPGNTDVPDRPSAKYFGRKTT